jgi:acyl-coenzyme A thioesterase PaaI-like protein
MVFRGFRVAGEVFGAKIRTKGKTTMTDLMSLGRSILAKQPFSQLLGTELVSWEPGRAVFLLSTRAEFPQQHGIIHGGVLGYLIDTALAFAGGSILGEKVVTAEYKVN